MCIRDRASTYPLFHWGPIPWSFYIILAVSFGFMIHVRRRSKQKYSEACRPLLGKRVDGFWGKVIDLTAVFALLAGTATTFSLATPLLSMAISRVFEMCIRDRIWTSGSGRDGQVEVQYFILPGQWEEDYRYSFLDSKLDYTRDGITESCGHSILSAQTRLNEPLSGIPPYRMTVQQLSLIHI